MFRRYFFKLMLALVALNAALVIADGNYKALWGWAVALLCLGGWRNMQIQRDLKQAWLDDTTRDLHNLRQEITRG